MQHLRALARHKLMLFAAIAFILGGLILGMNWLGTTAPEPTTAEPQDIAAAMGEAGDEAPTEPAATAAPDEQVVVYVSGAVRAPDVYQLPKAARIKDLVLAAGGFTADADLERINLAERVDDGQHIHVPRQGEDAPADNATTL